MARNGIRVQDLFDEKILRQKVEAALALKNQILAKIYNRRAVEVDEVMDELLGYAERLRPMVADTSLVLEQALNEGRPCCSRPARPRCSTSTTAPTRSSLRPTRPRAAPAPAPASRRPGSTAVIAILKAYSTRVGEGPFPTELFDANGEFLRKTGAEFGTTTGRPRRCGWVDTVVGRYATRINGVTDFVITKLDVLTGLETIPVCVAYDVDGVRHDEMPVNQTDFHHAKPIYEDLPGWWEDITGVPHLRGPARARRPTSALEELIGARVSAIGVGPGATRSSAGTRCSVPDRRWLPSLTSQGWRPAPRCGSVHQVGRHAPPRRRRCSTSAPTSTVTGWATRSAPGGRAAPSPSPASPTTSCSSLATAA